MKTKYWVMLSNGVWFSVHNFDVVKACIKHPDALAYAITKLKPGMDYLEMAE